MTVGGDPEAFYVPDGDGFVATELTRGPWDANSQHAGPASALLGRELDRAGRLEQAQLARVTYEILGPMPLGPLELSAAVARPGRSVELVEGAISSGGRDVMRARAWRIRTTEVEAATAVPEPPAPPPPPAEDGPVGFFPVAWDAGFHTAMAIAFVDGGFLEQGPARAWLRMRAPLVAGEAPEPRDRVLIAADTGNGIAAPLDYERFVFINTDLTVNLRRMPAGEWVCLDSVAYADAHGIGMSDTMLLDRDGMVGRSTQALMISERG